MKKILVILACMASIILIVACAKSRVDKALDKIDKSIKKVEKSKDKMTKADFEALDKEMEEPLKVLNDALEDDEVGALDKLKIVGKVTKWAAVLVSAGFKTATDEIGKELKESGVTGDDLKKAFKEVETAGGEIEKALKEASAASGKEE